MRPAPKLPRPMPGDEIESHLLLFCDAMDDLAAWIEEAVAEVRHSQRAESQSRAAETVARQHREEPWTFEQ